MTGVGCIEVPVSESILSLIKTTSCLLFPRSVVPFLTPPPSHKKSTCCLPSDPFMSGLTLLWQTLDKLGQVTMHLDGFNPRYFYDELLSDLVWQDWETLNFYPILFKKPYFQVDPRVAIGDCPNEAQSSESRLNVAKFSTILCPDVKKNKIYQNRWKFYVNDKLKFSKIRGSVGQKSSCI